MHSLYRAMLQQGRRLVGTARSGYYTHVRGGAMTFGCLALRLGLFAPQYVEGRADVIVGTFESGPSHLQASSAPHNGKPHRDKIKLSKPFGKPEQLKS
jgi:hypothetical protein